MTDETSFLRALIAQPGDAATRLAYADWLEQKQDPRAAYLRLDPELGRLSYVAWLEQDGHLDYYLKSSAEIKQAWEARKATEAERNQRLALQQTLDPAWTALVDALGCAFEPFYFFNNHGNLHEIQADELPFAEPIGTRGDVVTFESDFRDASACDPGLGADLAFLRSLELADCYYGAACCPLHRFACEFKTAGEAVTGADVIAALRPREFRSKHIETLQATSIPFPGYHPSGGMGIDNDEVHNDFFQQHLFRKDDEDGEFDDVDEFSGLHGDLKRYVADGQLWYVLLHCEPEQVEEFLFARFVVLFAVGRSPHGERLVGVVTHQVCHNLCD